MSSRDDRTADPNTTEGGAPRTSSIPPSMTDEESRGKAPWFSKLLKSCKPGDGGEASDTDSEPPLTDLRPEPRSMRPEDYAQSTPASAGPSTARQSTAPHAVTASGPAGRNTHASASSNNEVPPSTDVARNPFTGRPLRSQTSTRSLRGRGTFHNSYPRIIKPPQPPSKP